MLHPSTRRLGAVVLVAALVLPLAACGGGDVAGIGAQLTSPPRGAGDGGPQRGPLEEALPDDLLPEGVDPDELLPDLSVPGAEELDLCLEVAAAYAGLAFSALGGPEAAAEARQVAEDLKASLPEDLHDDIDVVADAYAGLAEDGLLDGAGALDDPEFGEANANIQAYLEETCGGG